MVGFWNADNYFHGWGYQTEEAGVLQAIQDYGASGFEKKTICSQNYSRGTHPSWGHHSLFYPDSPNNKFQIIDKVFVGGTKTYDISSCDYRVFSGPSPDFGLNTLNGIDYLPPGWTETLDWTSRPCNGSFTVTVGARGNCRTEVQSPIRGYVSKDILTVLSRTANKSFAPYTGIVGSDDHGNPVANESQTIGLAASLVNLTATVGSTAISIMGYIEGTTLVVTGLQPDAYWGARLGPTQQSAGPG